ncbi:hypothetical protein HOK51_07160 [Candidatus Woesearchaeota archaeon]|nr:hypothetical protein [Candidatus Woesearchaeota archaeon]MBT6519600.1 hypothetical protein [Candidatus Woesearchaeota archaeon]MBT7367515.1 hypothetical protein [Candidatus Woesearchaeota archaeon]
MAKIKNQKLMRDIEKVENKLHKLKQSIHHVKHKHNKKVDHHKDKKFFHKLHGHGTGQKNLNRPNQHTHNILPATIVFILVLSGIISLFYADGGITGSTIQDVPEEQINDKLYDSMQPFVSVAKYVMSLAFFVLLIGAGILFFVHGRQKQ